MQHEMKGDRKAGRSMYISLALAVVGYVLKAIGLQTMAKQRGIKQSWISWVPFFSKWVQCKLAGPQILFGRFRVENVFFLILIGSIAGNVLFKIFTPLSMGLLVGVAVLTLYCSYVMLRGFYAEYTDRAPLLAGVAIFISGVNAIFIYVYSGRELQETAG